MLPSRETHHFIMVYNAYYCCWMEYINIFKELLYVYSSDLVICGLSCGIFLSALVLRERGPHDVSSELFLGPHFLNDFFCENGIILSLMFHCIYQ